MLRATSSSTGGRQAVAGRPVGSGLASLAGSTLGVHAAQSLQARPGQARAPSWGSAKVHCQGGHTAAMLRSLSSICASREASPRVSG